LSDTPPHTAHKLAIGSGAELSWRELGIKKDHPAQVCEIFFQNLLPTRTIEWHGFVSVSAKYPCGCAARSSWAKFHHSAAIQR
jgi:hypothetical protein